MDLLNSSLVLYLMIGAGVGLAVYLADRAGTRSERRFRVATAVPFWPLYVPMLLRSAGPASAPNEVEPVDEMAAGIAQVDCELQAALGSLRGWAEGVFTREKDRLGELRSAWTAQADASARWTACYRCKNRPPDPRTKPAISVCSKASKPGAAICIACNGCASGPLTT